MRRRKELATPALWADLQEQALRMRRAPTKAETRLWQELRNGNLGGLRFRRQHPIARFIVDFYCVQSALVVEVDGPVHDIQKDMDEDRDATLRAMGLTILRFTNEEVMSHTEQVLSRIRQVAREGPV